MVSSVGSCDNSFSMLSSERRSRGEFPRMKGGRFIRGFSKDTPGLFSVGDSDGKGNDEESDSGFGYAKQEGSFQLAVITSDDNVRSVCTVSV